MAAEEQVVQEIKRVEELMWKDRSQIDTEQRELSDVCTNMNDAFSKIKLVHNYTCHADRDATYTHADNMNRMLNISVDNIDVDQSLDFVTSIKPLFDDKKLEYLDKIAALQAEFKSLEQSMIDERLT